jgi:membrane protease YdiL (CAAX protease family)
MGKFKRFLREFFPAFSLLDFFRDESLMIVGMSFFKYGVLLLSIVLLYFINPVFTADQLQKTETTVVNVVSPGIGEIAVLLLFVAVVGPLWEEFLFRGILLRAALGYLRPLLAIVLVAVLHGVMHGYLHSFPSFVGSLFYGFLFVKYRNPVATAIAHGINNALMLLAAALFGGGDDTTFDYLSSHTSIILLISLAFITLSSPILIRYVRRNRGRLEMA